MFRSCLFIFYIGIQSCVIINNNQYFVNTTERNDTTKLVTSANEATSSTDNTATSTAVSTATSTAVSTPVKR